MKIIDLLKIGRELMFLLSKSDIRMDDYRWVELFREYEKKRMDGEKYSCVIEELATIYHISPSTVSRIIRRLSGSVTH